MDDHRPSYEPIAPEAPGPGPAGERVGALARLGLAFTSPGRVFEAIRRRPTWVAPLVALTLLSVAAQMVVVPRLDPMAVREQVREQIGDDATEEQVDRGAEAALGFQKFAPLIGLLIAPVMFLILGGIYFLAMRLVGSELDYPRSLSTALHAYWPPGAAGTALYIVVALGTDRIDPRQARHLVASNLGAFLDPDTPAALLTVARSLDLFVVWTVALLAVGLSIVGGVRRRTATVLVVGVWVVWIAIKATLAGLLG